MLAQLDERPERLADPASERQQQPSYAKK